MAAEEKLSAKVSTAASEVASDIGSFIRTQRENAQVSVRQLAERSGVSNPYLSQVERGLRKPSADVLNQIAKALRVSAEVLYVQAGMLEPSDKSQVRDAIITDTAITERQKQVLLEIYASFTAQNEIAHEEHPTQSDPGSQQRRRMNTDANSLSMSRSAAAVGYPKQRVQQKGPPLHKPDHEPTRLTRRSPASACHVNPPGLDYSSREPSLAPPSTPNKLIPPITNE